MKTFLIILLLVVAGLVGLGFYRGWFSVLWDRGDGKGHITGTVDENKLKEDLKKVKNAGQREQVSPQ